MPMKRYKHEQIVTMLRQIEVSIANGRRLRTRSSLPGRTLPSRSLPVMEYSNPPENVNPRTYRARTALQGSRSIG
jgi:hypothetical protein